MKAVYNKKYGKPETLRIREIEKPVPADNEILVKVHAATVNRTDCAAIIAHPFFMRLATGLLKPKNPVPGTDFAGTVEETGKSVKAFSRGDRVFGFNDMGTSSHAEYLVIGSDQAVDKIPDNSSFEEAVSSCEGAHYAINFINKVDLKKGDKVLVYGATGAIGSAAVQLLKHKGADITAVCGTKNIDLIRSLGIDRVIDYQREDFTKDSARYKYAFDTVGKSSFFICRKVLEPGGIYISSELGKFSQNIFLALFSPLFRKRVVKFPYPYDLKGTVVYMKDLLEKKLFRPLIDREYRLEQAVEAYKYAGSGEKTGNVLLKMNQ